MRANQGLFGPVQCGVRRGPATKTVIGMLLVRVIMNAIIMALEVGAVVAVAWLGLSQPVTFAALTAVLSLIMGFRLEQARLGNEIPFYFYRPIAVLSLPAKVVALGEALFKAVLGGLVALLTFSGTDDTRLFWIAVIFGGCVYFGASVLRRLSMTFGGVPSRWGYFRLAAPLGLVYSVAVAFLPVPSVSTVARQLIFDLPTRPSLAQASETLFVIKQKFDQILVLMLTELFGPDGARVIGLFGSVNVLTGFVVAIYAVAISEIVRSLERRVP